MIVLSVTKASPESWTDLMQRCDNCNQRYVLHTFSVEEIAPGIIALIARRKT